MRIAIGSDEKIPLTDFVVEELKKRGHEVELFGPLKGESLSWVEVGEQVALSVEPIASEILDAWFRIEWRRRCRECSQAYEYGKPELFGLLKP